MTEKFYDIQPLFFGRNWIKGYFFDDFFAGVILIWAEIKGLFFIGSQPVEVNVIIKFCVSFQKIVFSLEFKDFYLKNLDVLNFDEYFNWLVLIKVFFIKFADLQ